MLRFLTDRIFDTDPALGVTLPSALSARRQRRESFRASLAPAVLASPASSAIFQLPSNQTQTWLIPYAAASAAIAVEVGDMMYDFGSSSDVAYPAGQLTTAGSEAADQAAFVPIFAGISLDKVLASETNATRRITLLTNGVMEQTCVSRAWAKGDLVGIFSDGVNLNSQKVDLASSAATAIGVCVKGTLGVASTRVTFAFIAKNYSNAKSLPTTVGALTVSSLVSSAATFPINGLTAAQGGSVTVTGGTSSTAGNVGGAVALVGGTPGSTSAGGPVTVTGGAGGSASGAGGAVTITGGVGTAGNAAGGAVNLIGGAGQGTANGGNAIVTAGAGGGGATGNGGAATITGGAATSVNGTGGAASLIGGLGTGTGAGGAITITSGAAGSTGVAGAVNIAVGAATAGNGSNMTLTGGNGAGGTNAGGDINLIPGTAVSTGIPGEVKVNNVAGLYEANWQQYLAASVPVSGTSYTMFLANRAYRVKAVQVVCSSGSTVPTVDIIKDTGTTAPGGGTSVLTGVITFSGTANTVVTGTVTSTVATKTLAAGDRLSHKWGGTVGSITGAIISVTLVPC